MNEQRVIPNFFVVGTPKAGTTALYHYLGQHPAVYMSPIKEPAFFASDLFEHKRRLGKLEPESAEMRAYLDVPMTEQYSGVISDWDQYLKLFKNAREETAIGEVSGNYLASLRAPAAIRARIPRARIIMIVRDPVDRLFSQYSQALSTGDVRTEFLSWVEEQQTQEASREPRLGAVWNGFYAQHLRRYLDHFPEQQVRVYFYQDYRRSAVTVLRDMFDFLGVDAGFVPDLSRRHNITGRPRSIALQKATVPLRKLLRKILPETVRKSFHALTHTAPRKITPVERAAVLKIYREDIILLQKMMKRDLSEWMSH